VRQELEAFEERIAQRGVDEKAIRAIARSVAVTEIARLRGEIEERLSKYGIDAEIVRQVINEVQKRLTDEIDKRVMHLVDVINEVGNVNKDILDIVNELLKTETSFEEELAKLRDEVRRLLSEEGLEEMIYRTMIRRGIIRQRKRRWAPIIAGLSILAAIIAGFLINPIATLVILFIVFAILLRW
jgi:phenylalanyl-tRNA synthetase beta subunit